MNHNYKGEAQLAYDENKLRLRLETRMVVNRINNEILREMTTEFQDALLRGEILTLGSTREELRKYITAGVAKALES